MRSKAGLNWVRTGTHHAETVVMIHAVGYDLTYWDRQIEALSGRYNVVAFDLPGHGLSRGEPEEWNFPWAARTIADLIEEASKTPVHLVGISFGGMLAQTVTLARPDLVRSLTLIGTAAGFAEPVRAGMRARAQTVRAEGMAVVLQSSLERWFTAETRERRPDLIDRVSKTILADNPAIHAAIWDIVAEFDVEARLGEIACPVLILVGAQDPSTPPAAASVLAAGVRQSQMKVLEGSHILTVEAPDAVNREVLEFLGRLS